jgi:hypothetical protein
MDDIGRMFGSLINVKYANLETPCLRVMRGPNTA